MTKIGGFETTHPSDKNKDVARVGHPKVGYSPLFGTAKAVPFQSTWYFRSL
jgi:hypothetical protein